MGLTSGGIVMLILLAQIRVFGRIPVSFLLYTVLLGYAGLVGTSSGSWKTCSRALKPIEGSFRVTAARARGQAVRKSRFPVIRIPLTAGPLVFSANAEPTPLSRATPTIWTRFTSNTLRNPGA